MLKAPQEGRAKEHTISNHMGDTKIIEKFCFSLQISAQHVFIFLPHHKHCLTNSLCVISSQEMFPNSAVGDVELQHWIDSTTENAQRVSIMQSHAGEKAVQ